MMTFGFVGVSVVMVSVSRPLRMKIIKEHAKTNNIAAAAESVGVSYNTAKRWVARSNVEDLPRIGRPKVLNEAAELKAMEALLNPTFEGADDVARQLHILQIAPRKVSRQTITRAARRAAKRTDTKLSVQRGKPENKLSDQHKHKRLVFAAQHLDTDWGHVVFTDRKRFSFRYPGEKVKRVVWCRRGQKQQVTAASHPRSVNVYAGLTRWGTTQPHVVAGSSGHKSKHFNKHGQPAKNITAAEYSDVLTHTLLPCSQRIFSQQGISFWQFQQDNDPTHRAADRIIHMWRQHNPSTPNLLRGWPPHSPDLSPIENMWAWVEAQVEKLGCKTFTGFQAAVLSVIEHVPKRVCASLVDSMASRLKKVITVGGDKIKY